MGHVIRGPAGWVVVGGLVAGALDITFACTYWAIARDVPPERILQSVASGLLGEASYDGGSATAALGLALHFSITLVMSAVYDFASRRLPVLARKPLPLGAAYGVALWLAMNYVVVPLSAAAVGQPGNDLWTWLSIAAHVLLVGIPIALCVRRAHAT
jgi:uncharacterized membrane protein YagU involved in acid resistance